jgi:hypothetical protein
MTRTFDWAPHPDARNVSVARLLAATTGKAESRNWRVVPRLDQGEEGACVGFGVAHDLGGYPHPQPVDADLARAIYDDAKTLDEWAGEAYEGTSVLAGAKAAVRLGHVERYYWCADANEVLLALSHVGPVVLGVWWRESMLEPTSAVMPTAVAGEPVGGHCVCAHGFHAADGLVRIRNSWGEGWGRRGDFFVDVASLAQLLRDDGEACVLVKPAG